MNPFQPRTPQQLERIASDHAIPGIIFATFNHGRLVEGETSVVGEARKGGQPLERTTIFPIASLSKLFTALICLHLDDQKVLRIDEPVASYLPSLSDTPLYNVTLIDLLTHTAGLTRDIFNLPYWENQDRTFPDSPEILSYLRREIAYVAPPRTRFRYSNLGYGVIQKILEKICAQPYSKLAQKYLIDPLNLQDSTPDQTQLNQAQQQRLMWGYGLPDQQGLRPLVYSRPHHTHQLSAATGWVTTLDDLAKVVQAMVTDELNYLLPATRERWLKTIYPVTQSRSYGLGLEEWTASDAVIPKTVGHFGWWFGVIAELKLDRNGSGRFAVINTIDDYTDQIITPVVDPDLDLPDLSKLRLGRFTPSPVGQEHLYQSIWGSWYLLELAQEKYLLSHPTQRLPDAMQLLPIGQDGLWRVMNGDPFVYALEPVKFFKQADQTTGFIIGAEVYKGQGIEILGELDIDC